MTTSFSRLRSCRDQLKCDGTVQKPEFRLSAKRTSPFKSAEGRQFSRLLAAEVCASALVMLDTPCSEVVRRVLATHSIRQFPLHFPSLASPCAISGSNAGYTMFRGSVKGTGYPLHSPVSPSLPLPYVIVYHHISAAVYYGNADKVVQNKRTGCTVTIWRQSIARCVSLLIK